MIRRFMRLPASERALLPRLVLLVAAIRVALWAISFARLQHVLQRRRLSGVLPPSLLESLSIRRLAWAVQVASRPVPAATCLTQSLALQFLLARCGRPSRLRIGVAKSDEHGFRAHAWVDCNGEVLLDRPEDIAVYTPLASWESAL